jgi:hypothetical protein
MRDVDTHDEQQVGVFNILGECFLYVGAVATARVAAPTGITQGGFGYTPHPHPHPFAAAQTLIKQVVQIGFYPRCICSLAKRCRCVLRVLKCVSHLPAAVACRLRQQYQKCGARASSTTLACNALAQATCPHTGQSALGINTMYWQAKRSSQAARPLSFFWQLQCSSRPGHTQTWGGGYCALPCYAVWQTCCAEGC